MTPPQEFRDPAWISPALLEVESNLEIPLTRARFSSAAPSISIQQAEMDPAERPTTAPRSLKAARNVARKAAPPAPEPLPPSATPPAQVPPPASAGPSIQIEGDDKEETLVGAVPKNLLALSTEDEEENTRAYQAPQELIELARREREGQLQPLARANGAMGGGFSELARSSPDDAAPPVARSLAPRGEPSSYRPSEGRRSPILGGEPLDRASSVREPPDSDDPDSIPSASEVSSASEPPLLRAFERPQRIPRLGSARRATVLLALLVLSLLMAAGYAFGRARGFDLARFLP